jgi:phosphate starvation-inducible PhoH-like protein
LSERTAIAGDESVTQKVSTEGADLLTLAGVNDANLLELSRLFGVKVSLRGEAMVISGAADFVARAVVVGRRMVEIARQRDQLTPDDVLRLGDDQERDGGEAGGEGAARIALPGVRKVIQAKTPGQAEYLQLIADNDIVVGIGPAGTGKTYLAVAAAVDALTRKRVRRIVLARPAVDAGEGRPLASAVIRRARRDDAVRAHSARAGDEDHRNRAAGVHARADAR